MVRRFRSASCRLLLLWLPFAPGCARGAIALPSGPGTALTDYDALFAAATNRCRQVRSLSAELALSGRAGRTRLRGRILAGLSEPASIRLEGIAPFGAPGFILAAHPGLSVLLLPRDHRVLIGAPPAAIVESLAGIALEPDELRAILVGCVAPAAVAVGGRSYPGDWVAIDLAAGSTAYLRTIDGIRHVAAASIGQLTIEYAEFADGLPQRVRLRKVSNEGDGVSDLTVRVSQLEVNVVLGPEVFAVEVPTDAEPITLEELRSAGPLGTAEQP